MIVLIGTKGEYSIEPFVEQSGQPFNAESIAKALMKALQKYEVQLEKIKFYVLDANMVAKAALDEISVMTAATRVLLALEEEEGVELEHDSTFVVTIQEFVRTKMSWAVEVLCRGHFRKTCVDHMARSIEWQKTRAYKFARCFNLAVSSADCSAKVKRMKLYVGDRARAIGDKKGHGFKALKDLVNNSLDRLRSGIAVTRQSLVYIVEKVKTAADAAGIEFDPVLTESAVIQGLLAISKHVDDLHTSSEKGPRWALLNATLLS
jgi:hypothetical protein